MNNKKLNSSIFNIQHEKYIDYLLNLMQESFPIQNDVASISVLTKFILYITVNLSYPLHNIYIDECSFTIESLF